MKFLISTTEVYRTDTESEAAALVDEAKNDKKFVLAKYTTEQKEVKAKGEVIETYFKTTLTKQFTSIKEPDVQASVEYTVE